MAARGSRAAPKGLDLGLHEQPGVGRQEFRDAHRRGVGAMSGAKGVVDVQVGVVGQGLGEHGVVPFFLDVEAQVLEQERLARPEPLDGVLGAQAQGVTAARHVQPEELAQALRDGSQPKAVLDLALGTAEMARKDDPRALAEQRPDRREGGPDA